MDASITKLRSGLLGLLTMVTCLSVPATTTATSLPPDIRMGLHEALDIVGKSMREPKLNSIYGQAFDRTGRRVSGLFLNFTGKGERGEPLLMSVTLEADNRIVQSPYEKEPRPDTYGHHLKGRLELERWFSIEEAVSIALEKHPDNSPENGISIAYYHSSEGGKKFVIVVYWPAGDVIPHTTFDSKSGEILDTGTTPKSRVLVVEFQKKGS